MKYPIFYNYADLIGICRVEPVYNRNGKRIATWNIYKKN